MKTIKIIARTYEKKAGGKFTKLSCKGKFLNLALAEDETTYTVKFVKGSECQEPQSEGIYEVAYADGDLWIDTRPEVADKNIVRIKAHKCVFNKYLPKLDKDIRI